MKRIQHYTVFDVETPNHYQHSLCSLGIVRVESGMIEEKKHYLIQPEEAFDPFHVQIHGITPMMVREAPTFLELWPEIKYFFEGRILVAHNALFDLSVLRKTLQRYGIFSPSMSYYCTLRLSRKSFPSFSSHGLANLCERLDIEFHRHHHALEDALATQHLFEILQSQRSVGKLKRYGDYDGEFILEDVLWRRALEELKEKRKEEGSLSLWIKEYEIFADAYPLSHLLWLLQLREWDEELDFILSQWLREPF